MEMRQKRFLLYQSSEGERTGLGENGYTDIKLSPEEQKEVDEVFAKEGFNMWLSDKIALDRGLKDQRRKQ